MFSSSRREIAALSLRLISGRFWVAIPLVMMVALTGGLVVWAQTPTDTTAPTVTLTTPLSNAVITPPLAISGTAADTGTGGGAASGVSRVDVQLSRSWGNAAGTTEYWTGTTWSATVTNLTTALTGTQPNVNWSVSSPLPTGADLRPGQYRLSLVRSVDGRNNLSLSQSPSFYIGPQDTTAPTTTFTNPPLSASLDTTTGAATGVASDPVSTNGSVGSGVSKVTLQLYRTWTGVTEFWSGTAWSTNNTVFTATLGTTNASNEVAWSSTLPWPTGANLPRGRYILRAGISDRWGLSRVVDNNLVSGAIDTTAPTVGITSPLANAQLTSLTSITGTATDDTGGTGISQVLVQLKRSVLVNGSAQTQYWNGLPSPSGAWTTSATYLLTRSETSWLRNTNLPVGADLPLGSYSITAQSADRYNNSALATTPFSIVLLSPTGLTAAPGNAIVNLSWTASAGASSYKVFRATATGAFNFASPLTTVAATTYTDSGLSNGTPYFYVVRAVNASGESPSSNEVSATPVAPPSAPTALTATAGNAQITLNWGASAGATSYTVRGSSTAGGPYTVIASEVTATTYTHGNLTNGTTYFYVVRATNASGESPSSNEASATPLAPPSAPIALTATAGNAQITLNWNASASASTYSVSGSSTAGGPYSVIASEVTATTYTHGNLTNGTTYFYVVRATNAGGSSANSNQVAATPIAPPLMAPTGLTAKAGNAQVMLSWKTAEGATSYTVSRSTISGGLYTDLTSNITSPTYTNTGLTNGTTYFYVVKSNNANSSSSKSKQVSSTPNLAPSAPQPPSFEEDENSQVSVVWSPLPNNAKSLYLEQKLSEADVEDFTRVAVFDGDSTSVPIGPLYPGKQYDFRFVAQGDAGVCASTIASWTRSFTAPGSLQITEIGMTTAKVSLPFMPTGADALAVELREKVGNAAFTQKAIKYKGNTIVELTNLSNDKVYEIRAVGIGAGMRVAGPVTDLNGTGIHMIAEPYSESERSCVGLSGKDLVFVSAPQPQPVLRPCEGETTHDATHFGLAIYVFRGSRGGSNNHYHKT